ncbi:MAG: hypothetical protein WC389_18830 [Lutibacter sp.]|jgi:hypothetical protein
MEQHEALRIAKNWYNSRPDEQEATLKYLEVLKEFQLEQMQRLINRIHAIETLYAYLREQHEEIPDAFLKAFEDG